MVIFDTRYELVLVNHPTASIEVGASENRDHSSVALDVSSRSAFESTRMQILMHSIHTAQAQLTASPSSRIATSEPD